MPISEKLKGHLGLFGANVCWGLMAPIAKTVMMAGVVTPLLLTDFRIVGAAVLFWILSLFTRREHVPAADLLRLAGAGMLGILFNQGCYVFGVGLTSPGEASIITTTMPMWVMVLSRAILGAPVTWRKALGIGLGASGAVTLVWSSSGASGGNSSVTGDLLVFGAQLSYALYLTLYKNFLAKYSLVTLMKWMFTFAAIAVLPFSVRSIAATQWCAVAPSTWLGVAYVVFMGTFVAYILMMTGQKRLMPTVVGMYNYFQPVVATGVGLAIGLDTFTAGKAAAVVLIFGGVYLVTAATPDLPAKRKSVRD